MALTYRSYIRAVYARNISGVCGSSTDLSCQATLISHAWKTKSLLLMTYKALIVADPPHLPWMLGNMLITELIFDISWASGMLVPSDLEPMIW